MTGDLQTSADLKGRRCCTSGVNLPCYFLREQMVNLCYVTLIILFR